MLSGCVASGSPDRSLPALPAYLRRVDVPDPKAGEELLAVAARERLGRVQANCIIENTSEWYERVRKAYAGQISPDAIERSARDACSATKKKNR